MEATGPGTATGSCTLSCAEPVTTGEVVIVPDKQVYTVKPESDVKLSFDLTAVADREVAFLLLLDMDSDVSVTFPENVLWSDATPALAKGYIHCIELTYILSTVYSGFQTKYLGKINKPVDLTKGFVVYEEVDGEDVFRADLYRIGYVSEPITMRIAAPDDYWDQYRVLVNPGVTLSSLTLRGQENDDSIPAVVQGGHVEQLNVYPRAAVSVTSGQIDMLTLNTDGREEGMPNNFSMSGGSVTYLDIFSVSSYSNRVTGGVISEAKLSPCSQDSASLRLAGGTIGKVHLAFDANRGGTNISYTQTAGYCGEIVIAPGQDSFYYLYSGIVNVSGGTVGSIAISDIPFTDQCNDLGITLSACHVGSVSVLIKETASPYSPINPQIKLTSNVVLDRLDINATTVPETVHELLIGPGCTVGLGASVRQAEALGAIILNIDSTAVVTNLED